jgi:hypothetical protein
MRSDSSVKFVFNEHQFQDQPRNTQRGWQLSSCIPAAAGSICAIKLQCSGDMIKGTRAVGRYNRRLMRVTCEIYISMCTQIDRFTSKFRCCMVCNNLPPLRYKPEGRGFNPQWTPSDFSWTLSFRSHYGSGVDSTVNRNAYQESSLVGKDSRCVGLTTLPPRVDCLNILGASVSSSPRGPSIRINPVR